MKKLLALLTTMALLLTMTGAVALAEEVPYVGQVDVFNAEAANVGLCTGWMPDYIKKAAGVEMNGIANESGKFDLLVAAGSLPDVTIINSVDNLNYAIEAGLLLDIDTLRDKIPNLDKYSDANAPMMQYIRDLCSAGTGKLYGLNRMYCTSPIVDMAEIGGRYYRYDYYAELGYPEMHTFDDVLNVLKQMQENHPTTEDGKKVYGMSLFPDWDSGIYAFASNLMMDVGVEAGLVERDFVNYKNDENYEDIIYRSALADDSTYKEAMKFFFKANQMGLYDPDSMTQTQVDSNAKTQSGNALMVFGYWNIEYSAEDKAAGRGFACIPLATKEHKFVTHDLSACPGGTHNFVTISKDCKNIDAACALINIMYDPEFTITYMNGPRGDVWDQLEDGTPYMVEGGYEYRANLDFGKRGCLMMLTYHFAAPLPGCNGYSSDYTLWPAQEWTPADDALTANWKEHTINGFHNACSYLQDAGMINWLPASAAIVTPDDMAMIADRVKQQIKVANYKLILAADEDEFESVWSTLQADCEGMGMNDYVEWWIGAYKESCQAVAPYLAK